MPILADVGLKLVCDQILDRVLHNTDRKMQESLGELGTTDLPRFRAPGLVRCGNSGCTWRPPADWPDFLNLAGPEFTFQKVSDKWCIVCAECNTPVGWITEEEAKQLAGQVRLGNLWAPDRGKDKQR